MSYRSMLTKGKKNKTYVDIKGKTRTPNGQGGYVTTDSLKYSNILCRFNSLPKREEIMAYDKSTVFADYFVFLEYLSGVDEDDILVKTDDSREFAIKLIMDWDEDRNMMKLACLELGRND